MDQVERVEKLARLGVIHSIRPEDLEPAIFADRVVHCLAAEPARTTLDINGVDATATELYALLEPENTNELGSTHQCLA